MKSIILYTDKPASIAAFEVNIDWVIGEILADMCE